MNHARARALLPAYLDGELDLVTALEIEEHLQSCLECTREYTALRELQSLFADQLPGLVHPAPPALQGRVRAALRAADAAPGSLGAQRGAAVPHFTHGDAPELTRATAPRQSAPGWSGALRRYTPALALVVIAALLFLGIGLSSGWFAPRPDLLAQEVETAHVRSLMASHLTDVTSTDQHTVKPWFDGRLDFSPPVTDLVAQGFPLIGGRLDYIDGHQAAALVYMRSKHVINLLIWPTTDPALHPSAPQPPTVPQQTTINGYHLDSWTQSGMTFWAVSDLESGELLTFAQMIQKNSP